MTMMTRESRSKAREENRQVLKETLRDKDTIIAMETDRIAKRYEGIEAQIRELQDKRGLLMEQPITKEELLEHAKTRLQAERKHWIRNFLGEHLKACQEKNLVPFRDTDVKVHICSDLHIWKLFYFAISEKDLEEAVADLQEIGMPTAERDAKIAEINAEILKLKDRVAKDLKKLQK